MLKFHPSTAHLLSWIPNGHEEVLWLSAKAILDGSTAIRGGVPICWPWFGPKDGKPAHGFARNSKWELVSEEVDEGSTKISLEMVFEDKYKEYWAFDTRLVFEVEEEGNTLSLQLTTYNTGKSTIEITQALHTYFAISDISNIRIEGHEGGTFLDQLTGKEEIQSGAVTFDRETDRIYYTGGKSVLIDPGKNRKMIIEKGGSLSTVIWNPWVEKSAGMKDMAPDSYRTMVCVEAANTAADVSVIDPGGQYTISQEITIVRS